MLERLWDAFYNETDGIIKSIRFDEPWDLSDALRILAEVGDAYAGADAVPREAVHHLLNIAIDLGAYAQGDPRVAELLAIDMPDALKGILGGKSPQ